MGTVQLDAPHAIIKLANDQPGARPVQERRVLVAV
jgi:hypothetical protein